MITIFAAIEAQRKLYDWLVNHIGKSDKVLGAYLTGRITPGPYAERKSVTIAKYQRYKRS